MSMVRKAALFAGLATSIAATDAARGDLIKNGNFEDYTGGYGAGLAPSQINNTGTGGYTQVTNWTQVGGTYGFLMAPGAADTTGSRSPQFGNDFRLWGKNNGGPDAIPNSSPVGGNYLVLDGDPGYRGGGVSQTVGGLVIGTMYQVSMYIASGQQYTYNQDYWTQLQVSLGSESYKTAVFEQKEHTFRGWQEVKFTFTAKNTSETLNLLAYGSPGGLPPFVLVDGVSMSAVPEPSTIAMSVAGLLGLAGVGVRRRMKGVAA